MPEFVSGCRSSVDENNKWATQGGSTREWIEKGEAAFSGGDMEKAKECFDRALQRDPLNVKALNNLSVVHWTQGNTEESLGFLTRALEWDPNDKDVIINCCNIFKALGKIGDAVEILDAYLDRNPWEEEMRGILNLEDGAAVGTPAAQVPRAADPVAQAPADAKKTFEDAADFFTEQGEQEFEQGKLGHARACFEMALDRNPDHSGAHSNLGVVLWQEGDNGEALEHLFRALEIAPENPDIILNSAKVLADVGEVATAKNLFRLYLQRNPKDDAAWNEYELLVRKLEMSGWKPKDLPAGVADVYDRMGMALAEAGDVLGAAEAFKKTLLIDPERTGPYFQIARLHREIGQDAEAVTMLQELLRVDPSHTEGVLEAGRLLESLGRMEEARRLYETYLADYDSDDVRSALDNALKGV